MKPWTLCHVIRLLRKDRASLNNLDLSLPLKPLRAEGDKEGWLGGGRGQGWGDVAAHGRRGGRHLEGKKKRALRSWLRESERTSCVECCAALRGWLRRWENHVLENCLVSEPPPELHLRTQMNLVCGVETTKAASSLARLFVQRWWSFLLHFWSPPHSESCC